MSNAIKWTLGLPSEPRENHYLIFCVRKNEQWIELLPSDVDIVLIPVREPGDIKAHALINYPIPLHEAVGAEDDGDGWYYWDLNGTTRSTGYATREEAEAAYRDEYGDW